MESLVIEEEVLSRQTGIIAEKGYNISSDRCIVLKHFRAVSVGRFSFSTYGILLVEEEVLPC
jgi:hypothetical protein